MNPATSQPQPDKPASPEFAAFDALTRRLLAVPKAVIDAREAEYQRQQATRPKRGPKPGPKGD